MAIDDNLVCVAFLVRKTCLNSSCTGGAVKIVPVTESRPGSAKLELEAAIPTTPQGPRTWLARVSLPANTVLRYKAALVDPTDGSLISKEAVSRKLRLKREPVLVELMYNDPAVRTSVLNSECCWLDSPTPGLDSNMYMSGDTDEKSTHRLMRYNKSKINIPPRVKIELDKSAAEVFKHPRGYRVTSPRVSQAERNNPPRGMIQPDKIAAESSIHPRGRQLTLARARQGLRGGSSEYSTRHDAMWAVHLMHPPEAYETEESCDDEPEKIRKIESKFRQILWNVVPLGLGALFGLAIYIKQLK